MLIPHVRWAVSLFEFALVNVAPQGEGRHDVGLLILSRSDKNISPTRFLREIILIVGSVPEFFNVSAALKVVESRGDLGAKNSKSSV